MNRRPVLRTFLCALATAGAVAGCIRRTVIVQAPEPTPTPEPTPIRIPYQKLETATLFNGIKLATEFKADAGTNPTTERNDEDSFKLDLKLSVRLPTPATDLATLGAVTPALPQVLPALPVMLQTAEVSSLYEDLYRRKVERLENDLPRLQKLLSRHNFYDCETMLQMKHPETGRKIFLIQADMDVDMDGSDPDRVAYVDGSIPNFQPITSYSWEKRSERPNPFLASAEEKLKKLEAEFAVKGLPAARNAQLRSAINDLRYEVGRMRTRSFLVSEYDPYVVISLPMFDRRKDPFVPGLGDYCVVIHGKTLYPAIVGDVGPTFKAGEASLRVARAIQPKSTPFTRPVDELTATYIFFPGTADPFAPPDLPHWRKRCEELLAEIGGYQGTLYEWMETIPPLPTPTPIPSASPAATPARKANAPASP